MSQLRLAAIGGLLVMVACGPSVSDGADADTAPCSPGESRCSGNSYQECVDGLYQEQELCVGTQTCDPQLTCVDCRPSSGDTCVGNEVHTCNSDGTIGGLVEDCGIGMCQNGSCNEDCTADGADLIYLVDDTYRMWSFDPRLLPADPFQLLGNLSCSAGTPLGSWTSPATPFSMSVDRDARAWVLYTSGEIFLVDTANASSCTNSGFGIGQSGFELFGMGFVADSPGSSDETLFISGGSADVTGSGNLGSVDPDTLLVTSIGALPSADYSPEMTGTGDAKLFGYYPSDVGTNMVAEINKATGANVATHPLAALCSGDCVIRAWAFAHWGGQFYIFITTSDLLGLTNTARVILLDPDTGSNQVITGLGDTGKIIVGAGVSTCAPFVVP